MDWSQVIWIFAYTSVLLGLSAFGLHRYLMIFLFLKNSRKPPMPVASYGEEELPSITVQLPVFNELYVVERLIRSVGELDYPSDKLEIQVLDDSTDETTAICQVEVDRLVEKGLNATLIHRTDRTGFKAGALENGMKEARGKFIYILDADFVPPPDILRDLVHFFNDEKIGMVQARWGHLNRNYSLLTRIQSIFLDGHLILEQTARSRSGRFINFNGTAGMWRKSCITEAGGWEHDTLTEDLDLSYRAQLKGWKFVFLKDVVTPAELPVDMNGFKSQQHRWTKGSIQTCKKMLVRVWKSPVSLLIKIEATFHLTSNFAYLLLGFLCFLIYPAQGFLPEWEWMVLLNIPVFLAASVSVAAFYTVSQIVQYPKTWWREIFYLPLVLALGIGMSVNNGKAVLEAVFNQQSPFNRTPKYGIERKGQGWKGTKYSSLKSIALVFEVLMALYFTALIGFAMLKGLWLSIPFFLLFLVGFAYVAHGSLKTSGMRGD